MFATDSVYTSPGHRGLFGQPGQLSVFIACGLYEPPPGYTVTSKLWFAANFQVYHLTTLTSQLFLLSQENCTSSNFKPQFQTRGLPFHAYFPFGFRCQQSSNTESGAVFKPQSVQTAGTKRHWSEGVFFQASTPLLRETSEF